MSTKKELFAVTVRIASEVSEALLRATGKTIWKISESDRHKLYRLWMWSQRYSVSLDYILSVLVPYFSKGVEKRTGKKSKGLGVSIATLVGDVAEDVLQKAIAKDNPDSDHLGMYREEQRDKVLALLKKDSIPVRIKSTLQYNRLKESTDSIINSIQRESKRQIKIAYKLRKIPYRGNPFR